MYPPIFEKCAADATVKSHIGTSPVRLWPFGEAPQNATLPYAVWQTVGGGPENYFNQTPDADTFNLQVDIYAKTANSARAVAQALRNVIEQYAHITAWRGEMRDPGTSEYRYIFEVAWVVQR